MNILNNFKDFSFLLEKINNRHLLSIDIQPEYEKSFGNMIYDFVEYLNENYHLFSDITFLYNGEELGMINEMDYINWWIDMGLKEEVINYSNFFDKGYAFFRYCMDNDIEESEIVALVKLMYEKDITDSRDLDEDFWNEFVEKYEFEEIRDLIEFSDDCITIPELMDVLDNSDNYSICGGGVDECLKEVEIALLALSKNYKVLNEFTF